MHLECTLRNKILQPLKAPCESPDYTHSLPERDNGPRHMIAQLKITIKTQRNETL